MVSKMATHDNVSAKRERGERKVPCEVYSRIVGYLRPVQAWNDGKQQEFEERKTFDVSTVEEDGA
jgi:anaerobic ribonucleoside-triphosphate reductase